MFDDPKKELRRLEDALREVEYPEPEEEAFDEEETSGFSDPFDQDWYTEFLPEDNPALDFGRMVYADEELDDAFEAEPVGKRARARAAKLERKQKKKDKKAKKKKRKGIGGLVLLAMAEIAAILHLLRWWIQWLT